MRQPLSPDSPAKMSPLFFSVFGSGFYDAGSYWQAQLFNLPERERARWLQFLDAGRRAPHIKAAYFLASSTNHPYFWLSAAEATLGAITSSKNQVFAPNEATVIPLPGGTKLPGEPSSTWTEMEKSFFNFQLKGLGEPFPIVKLLADIKVEVDVVRPRFHVEGTFTDVSAFYSSTQTSPNERRWQKAVVVKVAKGIYEAIIPIEAARTGASWYALASSSHPATVSSLIAEVPKP